MVGLLDVRGVVGCAAGVAIFVPLFVPFGVFSGCLQLWLSYHGSLPLRFLLLVWKRGRG